MTTGKVLLGVLAGVAAGALLGVLFAPDKGSETRKKMLAKGDDLTDAMKEKFKDIFEEVKKGVEAGKYKANEFMADGKAKVGKSNAN